MLSLGIETSCDETGAAIVEDGRVLSNVVSSSVHLHKPYGGVIPEIASRYHVAYITGVVKRALARAGKKLSEVELVAVTKGPGLAGSLLSGISFAKSLAYVLRKPLVGVNHLTAHLYANHMNRSGEDRPRFPYIGLIVSGGHTSFYRAEGVLDYRVIGRTQDDAVGEAFDKVAKILRLGYPGGPVIERMARGFTGHGRTVRFPKPFLGKGSLDFSFSGIKTAVLYYARGRRLTKKLISEVSYAFQEAVFDVIVRKALTACKRYGASRLVIGGGVAANRYFYNAMAGACAGAGIRLFMPDLGYCLDNGAMVAALGDELYRNGVVSDYGMTAEPNAEIA